MIGKLVSPSAIGLPVSRLAGYAPALPTPFLDDGRIDLDAFRRFCDLQIKSGATGLVVCGTTGEAPTLTPTEHHALILHAVKVSRGQVPVIAGAGSNSTRHAVDLAQSAEAAGANALLVVVPYYNKPTQAGLRAHFLAVIESVGIPVILYDVPSRTACALADDTVAQLAEHPRCLGLKDATGDVTRVVRLRSRLGQKFRLLSGDDATVLPFLMQGGDGCISVTSNVVPGLCSSLYLGYRHGQFAHAQRLANALAPLHAALFRESNPVPVKYALSLADLMRPCVRLPLVELRDETKSEVATVLAQVHDCHSHLMIGAPAPGTATVRPEQMPAPVNRHLGAL